MQIVQFSAENVKRLRAVDITPPVDGNLVVIGGANAQGKSSILDAIAMAIGGKGEVPSVPVRRGEDKAVIEIDLGEIKVKRTFTQKGGTTLIVEGKDGGRFASPQKILDELTGKVTFDPLAFTRLDRKKQAETLRELIGVDVATLDEERKSHFVRRTDVNREVDRLASLIEFRPHFPDAPDGQINLSTLVDELGDARKHNDAIANRSRAIADRAIALGKKKQEATELRARVSQMMKEIADEQIAIAEMAEKVETDRAIDLDAIRAKIAGLELSNERARSNAERAKLVDEHAGKKLEADNLTKLIDQVDAHKQQQLAAAKYPVAGLGFDDEGVTMNGLPFDQASAAEQMRVSVAIAAALNPKLRVMMVRDGSLLDADSLARLAALAKEFDLQVWLERVGSGAECSVIIEDGMVVESSLV